LFLNGLARLFSTFPSLFREQPDGFRVTAKAFLHLPNGLAFGA